MTSGSRARRLSLLPAGVLLWVGCLSLFAQPRGSAPSSESRFPGARSERAAVEAVPSAATVSQAPPSPAAQAPAGRAGQRGRGNPDAGADFSPKPPIQRITQTATVGNASPWTVQRLRLYQPPPQSATR